MPACPLVPTASTAVSIIAILGSRMVGGREERVMNVNPYPNDIIKKGDIIVLLGADKDIARLEG